MPSFSDRYSPVSTTIFMAGVRKLDTIDVAVLSCSAGMPFMLEAFSSVTVKCYSEIKSNQSMWVA